ncbi:MAG: D-serine ammonia-lyase [Thermoanaerobacteraceae bacterium]|nr:D-serine ammonia-lyase [Thermoanaerobacteraceae bacterium]
MNNIVLGKPMETWLNEYPLLKDVTHCKPVFWKNPEVGMAKEILPNLPLTFDDILDAEARWKRFASLIKKLFPKVEDGIIESRLVEISDVAKELKKRFGEAFEGPLYLKCDNELPVAGSVKARGGVYEVLKHAEELVINNGLLNITDDYSIMSGPKFREFFSNYSISVGSTGNLGLSIGIMGSALGFKVTVHMSADAKEWKKRLLRERGVNVIEYTSDYSKAVEEGRRLSSQNPMDYFVDDENSKDLFLGYSVAALRLKKQLDDMGINISEDNPINVYIPCGVGGAPGGITFGLKHVFGDNVRCYFAEPSHSPCMLLGLMTGLHDRVSVFDFGLDGRTEADGLAVGRPSKFAGRIVERLVGGIFTVNDDDLYRMLAILKDKEGIKVEPSAAAGLLGIRGKGIHMAWATGGIFVPEDLMDEFYNKGRKLLGEE